MSLFPSDKQFEYCVAENKRAAHALNWKDLPKQVVYRVQPQGSIVAYRVQPQGSIETKRELDTLLELVNRENKEVKVWVPQSLANTLCYDDNTGSNRVPYIRSLGLQRKRPAVETVFLRDHQPLKKVKGEQPEQWLEKSNLLKVADKIEVPEQELKA